MSDYQRIAKNTIFLYVRMGLSMCVSLYTSRVVLQTLGVLDYGLWNLIAGVITMFGFLNASMAGCTSRYITYELANGTVPSIQRVFSCALTIHLLISLIVLVLGESVGLWFINHKLVIPESRMFVCHVIYQLTIISTLISITQVPYNSVIMANEHMSVYAYVEILNVLLRLGIVYLLLIIPADKLLTYGVLSIIVSVTIALIYRWYCVSHYAFCRFIVCFDEQIVKPMLSFVSWDLIGNVAVIARTQGVSFLLNIFFTATLNAASGVATSVQNAVSSFSSNVVAAFRPQIVKSYARGDYDSMSALIYKALTYTTLLQLLFIIPLELEMPYILQLWLQNPPAYSIPFCRWILVFLFLSNISYVTMAGIHATGRIKYSSIINGLLYTLVVPFSFFAFKYGLSPTVSYMFNALAVAIGMSLNLFLLHKYISAFSLRVVFFRILFRLLIVILIDISVGYVLINIMEQSFIRLLVVGFCSFTMLFSLGYSFLLDRDDCLAIKNKIRTTIYRKNG